MTWRVEFDDRARKELRKLDHQAQKRILKFLQDRIAPAEDPRQSGKALQGVLAGLWRYRVDDYRIIAHIEDQKITILVLRIGHRRDVYD